MWTWRLSLELLKTSAQAAQLKIPKRIWEIQLIFEFFHDCLVFSLLKMNCMEKKVNINHFIILLRKLTFG